MRILVVDDEPDIVETTSELLRMMGHEVETATDWRVVTQKAKGCDLVLHDMRMPGLDMVERMPELRAAFQGRIVLFTAERILDPDAASLDADGLLRKPFGVEDAEAVLA